MHIPRIHHPERLIVGSQTALDDGAASHISRVLRMTVGQYLQLSDGNSQMFDAAIAKAGREDATVKVLSGKPDDHESPLHIHLGQAMSYGEKMESIIQKSIGFGVNLIAPLFSERCGVKLDARRLRKKTQQWRKITIAACEQSGHNAAPEIRPTMQLEGWCAERDNGMKLNLHPRTSTDINTLLLPVERVRLLTSPGNGPSAEEIAMTAQYQFTDIPLGPRVLHTETTALTAIIALQVRSDNLD